VQYPPEKLLLLKMSQSIHQGANHSGNLGRLQFAPGAQLWENDRHGRTELRLFK